MGIDRTSGGSADEPDGADQGNEEPDQPEYQPSPGRPQEQVNPSRVDAGRAGMEASRRPVESTTETSDGSSGSKDAPKPVREAPRQNEQGGENRDDTPQKDRKESDATLGAADTGPGQDDEHKPPDAYASSLEQAPSYGGFANLGEEFEARAKSREAAEQYNNAANDRTVESDSKRDLASPKLDEKSIREQIDPFAPDLDKVEGRKEPFQQTIRDNDAEWTEGVDRFDDLPPGEKLTERGEDEAESNTDKNVDQDKRSRREKLRDKLFEHGDDALDGTQEGVNAIGGIFDRPQPTGSHAIAKTDQPIIEASPHGVDAGEAATALIAGAVVASKLYDWGREMVARKRRDDDGNA
ncbi:hypothetical protein [Actinoallomurus sp. NPDC050550]|uniref:hypothetical protein n=1 Tax=Actinoallomurus sp. NPDC050550 TaxID=3154937 RepID=UPI0033FCBA3E